MYLNKKPTNIYDAATTFPNATFLKHKSAEDIWQDFHYCWDAVYTGFPDIFTVDREPTFVLEIVRSNANGTEIDFKFSGIESKNAIGQGKISTHTKKNIQYLE